MVWYSHLLKNFPQFIVIHTVKGFGIVSKAEIDVFLELSCFFHDPADVGNLISGSSTFSKTSQVEKSDRMWSTGEGKILQSGFSNTRTMNFQMFKLALEKAEEPEIKLPTSFGSLKKQESSRKISISGLLTMPKPLTVCIAINSGKFLKRWEYHTI